MAAQLTATSSPASPLPACTARAMTSFPHPLSATTRTVCDVGAMARSSLRTRRIPAESPASPSTPASGEASGSSATPRQWRLKVWERIGTDLRPRHLKEIVTRTIDFADLPAAFPPYLTGAVTGRTVVRIG